MVSRRNLLVTAARFAAGATVVAGCRSRADEAMVPSTGAPTSGATTVPSTTLPDTTVPDTGLADTTVPASNVPATTEAAGPAVWDADFDEFDAFLASTNSRSFILVDHGVTIHEWHRDDPGFVRDIASAQKSVLAMLVGRAVADGLFELATPVDDVLGSSWTPHGRSAGITIDHLLTMTSGLDDQREVVAEPGAAWIYSGAFAALFDVLTTSTGRSLADLSDEWLFAPAGASGARFYERTGTRFAPIGLRAGVRDLAAIGRTVLDRSQPGVPDRWHEESTAPTQQLNLSYGRLWWLNGQPSYVLPGGRGVPRPGPLVPPAPSDMVAALGKDDQKLYLSPASALVVARLGDRASSTSTFGLSTFDADLWTRLTAMRR